MRIDLICDFAFFFHNNSNTFQMTPNIQTAPDARPCLALRPLSAAIPLVMVAMGSAWPLAVRAQNTSADLPAVTVTAAEQKGYDAKDTQSATRTDTPLLDTPQSVSVVTPDQMRDRAVQSVAEAVRYVPGVSFAQGEGNRETPIIRGISSTGDFFIDGIRDDVQYYRDLYNIESVEVFKGPNAMIFGRGATGGLINRVSKQANWQKRYGASLTLGSENNRRITADVNQPVNDELAIRVMGMYENSDSYRDGVSLERSGVSPTLSWRPSSKTLVTAGYEHFRDDRIADRGISSYQGRPVDTDPSTFFGNAQGSPTWTELDAVSALVEHQFSADVLVRNKTRWSSQDKFYQNVFPGAVNAAGSAVSIAAYNNATRRDSVFNQTDAIINAQTGALRHKLLVGMELGRQDTDNFRNTGYFPGNVTNVSVPLSDPTTHLPVTYRQSATDADNTGQTTVAALYVQDQLEITRQFLIVGGLRYDNFKVDFRNNRNGQSFNTNDHLVSPRIGVIYKPLPAASVYANYSVAYQPRAGDQLSSLSLSNAALEPEKFNNYEVGVKWDVRPNLSTTFALYQLDRTNVVVLDPSDPTGTRTMLADGQRTRGVEIGISGNVTSAWSVAGGYSYVDATLSADTSATLRKGAELGQVPRHTFTLWNRYDFTPMWGAGLGVIYRSKMYASTEQIASGSDPYPNVTLPGYTRVDAAVFMTLSKRMSAQLNIENLFDKKYYANANSNTNITPGSPRAVRVSLNAAF
jgi:catecholate siderophore receptor